MPRRQRKKQKRGYFCAGCAAELEVDEAPDEVLLCEDCHDRVNAADIHWFVSHVDPTFISGSSDEAVLKPSPPPLGPSTVAGGAATARAKGWIADADAVLVLAGAGMSRDSALPDFRGRDGWYSVGGAEVSMEHMDFHETSPHWETAWRALTAMAAAFRGAAPHAGYARLRRLAAEKRVFVVTSNIDELFPRAGFDDNVYETHGSALRLQCSTVGTDAACGRGVWALDDATLDTLRRRYSGDAVDESAALPRCACGAAARPNLSHATDRDEDIDGAIKGAQRARMEAWLAAERRSKLVVLEVGCGTSVHSLRLDSEIVAAAARSAKLVRVDPGDARVPEGANHAGVALGAEAALVALT